MTRRKKILLLLLTAGVVAGVSTWQLVRAALPSVSFSLGTPAELEVRTVRARDGGAVTLVHPRINGEDVGWFALDSGASALVIDKDRADALGLSSLMSVNLGECDLKANIRRASTFELGPLTIHNPLLVALDLGPLNESVHREIGEPLAGAVGYTVFAKTIVEIRYGGKSGADRVLLHDPASFELKGGAWMPLEVSDRVAVVPALFEGDRQGRFMIDTGKSGSLSLYANYATREGLLDGREVTREPNGTVCGETVEMEGRLAFFELAGVRFTEPLVRFKLPHTINATGGEGQAGTIGRGLLDSFTVVFNYPGEKIAFLQNRGVVE